MKQTAVEWYEIEIDSLFKKYEEKEISYREFITRKHNLFYQAKVLEKKQIVTAFINGNITDCTQEQDALLYALEYYNKTFTIQTRIENDNINVTNK